VSTLLTFVTKSPVWIGFVTNLFLFLPVVAIFFAPAQKAELPEWMDKVVVAFVAFYVLMHLILSVRKGSIYHDLFFKPALNNSF